MPQHDVQPVAEDITPVVQSLQVALVGQSAEQVVGRRKGEASDARKLLRGREEIV
jgi:hypothetical protein